LTITIIWQVEEEGKTKKAGFVDHKRIVWHEAFHVLLDSIRLHSKTGCWMLCGDDVVRLLFPVILMFSSDYEEQ
jgi:hypothetical protein